MKSFKKILLEIVALGFQELQKIPFAFSPYAAVQHMMECTWISKPCPPHEFNFSEQSHTVKHRTQSYSFGKKI